MDLMGFLLTAIAIILINIIFAVVGGAIMLFALHTGVWFLGTIVKPLPPSPSTFDAVDKGEVLVCAQCGRLNSPTRTHCKTCETLLYNGVTYRPRVRTMEENRGLQRGSYLKCPYCNRFVEADALRCSACHHELDEMVMPLRAYRPEFEGNEEVLVCIRCGRVNNPTRTECKRCHTALEKPAPAHYFKDLTED